MSECRESPTVCKLGVRDSYLSLCVLVQRSFFPSVHCDKYHDYFRGGEDGSHKTQDA